MVVLSIFLNDSFSRRVWTYLIKDKFETFVNLKNWKSKVENQIGKNVKYLHTDDDFEFYNAEFDSLCN